MNIKSDYERNVTVLNRKGIEMTLKNMEVVQDDKIQT